MNFPPPSIPSPPFCDSGPEAKRALDSNVIVAKGMPSNDIWSSASVTRRAARTLASSRRAARTSDVISWRNIISGDFGPLRIWSRMSLARATGCEEKASMFHDTRERPCAQEASMFRDMREGLMGPMTMLRSSSPSNSTMRWTRSSSISQRLKIMKPGMGQPLFAFSLWNSCEKRKS